MNPSRPIVIDTDAGWDDWLALLFLMKCPQVRILGVTVTGVGLAHLTPGMTNMSRLLVFGGQAANVYLECTPRVRHRNKEQFSKGRTDVHPQTSCL
jgi:inosine-uridine nucleoside N-ribohydrolase